MGTVIRTMDYGEGGPEYRIHFEITSPFVPAQTYGPPERCYPSEGPEWEITSIDEESWNKDTREYSWVDLDKTNHTQEEVEAVWSWAEGLDLSDEAVEDAMAERDAYLEAKGDAQREGLED
jgi:hypothetical protein